MIAVVNEKDFFDDYIENLNDDVVRSGKVFAIPYKSEKNLSNKVNGSCWRGYLPIFTANELIKKIGMPTRQDNMDKVDFEWVISDSRNNIATIYNWKDGPAWFGQSLQDSDYNVAREWHIGGHDNYAINMAYQLLNLPKEFNNRYVCTNCKKGVDKWKYARALALAFDSESPHIVTDHLSAQYVDKKLLFCSKRCADIYSLNPVHLLNMKIIDG